MHDCKPVDWCSTAKLPLCRQGCAACHASPAAFWSVGNIQIKRWCLQKREDRPQLPMVLLVHGGPWARGEIRSDSWQPV